MTRPRVRIRELKIKKLGSSLIGSGGASHLTGRVGPVQEVCNSHGSGRDTLARSYPREVVLRPVRSPDNMVITILLGNCSVGVPRQ